jgi:hypothetical protein
MLRLRAGSDLSSEHSNSPAQANQSIAAGLAGPVVGLSSAQAIVSDLDSHLTFVGRYRDSTPSRSCVLDDVCKGFLDDPVDGQRESLGQLLSAPEIEVDVDAGQCDAIGKGR